jgi:pyridoxine 5'-phosphate synthase PdxJ
MPRAHLRLAVGPVLVAEAIFVGLEESVRTMRALMDEARGELGIAAE